MAFSSASVSKVGLPFLSAQRYPATADRSNGSGISGVTGLRTSEGKSRMLGDRISGFRGENPEGENPDGEIPELLEQKEGFRGLILRFFIEFLRS